MCNTQLLFQILFSKEKYHHYKNHPLVHFIYNQGESSQHLLLILHHRSAIIQRKKIFFWLDPLLPSGSLQRDQASNCANLVIQSGVVNVFSKVLSTSTRALIAQKSGRIKAKYIFKKLDDQLCRNLPILIVAALSRAFVVHILFYRQVILIP